MTTFSSRETVRDALVALFTTNAKGSGQFQEIYGYAPSTNEILATSPILIIRSDGSRRLFNAQETNPVDFRFVLTTMILAYDANSSPVWTSAMAEDKLDDLERLVAQIIRDNTQNAAWNVIYLEDGFSEPRDVIIGKGVPYIIETRTVIARLSVGAI